MTYNFIIKIKDNTMHDLNKSLAFLKISGLFFVANDEIPDLTMDDLNNLYHEAMIKLDFNRARLVAEKISILYGIKGLIPYFNVSFLLAQRNKYSHEIIDQDVIKVLSLIFFVEKNVPSEFNCTQLDEVKEKFISICDQISKDEIISEAYDLCKLYMKFARNSDKINSFT